MGARLTEAKTSSGAGAAADPKTGASVQAPLARAEPLDRATRLRVDEELQAALKRRGTQEGRLGGVLRVVAPLSAELAQSVEAAAKIFVKRKAWNSPLLLACMWALVEAGRGSDLLRQALSSEDSSSCLALAAWDRGAALAPLLTRLSTGPSSVAMFSEGARVCRGEANGMRLTELSTRAKESVRLDFVERFAYPLTLAPWCPPKAMSAALAVLRSAERHLGRWLVLGELAHRSGDRSAQQEAEERAEKGPDSARPAWALVAWALAASGGGAIPSLPPGRIASSKLTTDLLARLSDRPSADRDLSFLFRLGRARVAQAKTALESVSTTAPGTVDHLRALSLLAREYGSVSAHEALVAACRAAKDETKGIAVAALWDAGAGSGGIEQRSMQEARELASELVLSRHLPNVAWGALVRVDERRAHRKTVLTERNLRALRG